MEQRRKFTSFIRDSIPKAFISELIRNLYATPLLLFVPSAPLWNCLYLRPLRSSVCLWYKTFSLSLHISEKPYSITKMTSEKTIQCLPKINHRITCILHKNDVPLRAYSIGNKKDTFLYRKAMIQKGILGNIFLNKFP